MRGQVTGTWVGKGPRGQASKHRGPVTVSYGTPLNRRLDISVDVEGGGLLRKTVLCLITGCSAMRTLSQWGWVD